MFCWINIYTNLFKVRYYYRIILNIACSWRNNCTINLTAIKEQRLDEGRCSELDFLNEWALDSHIAFAVILLAADSSIMLWAITSKAWPIQDRSRSTASRWVWCVRWPTTRHQATSWSKATSKSRRSRSLPTRTHQYRPTSRQNKSASVPYSFS